MFRFDREVGTLLLGVAFLYGFVATDVAVAQVGTGSIQGTVSDSSGAIIAGTSVTMTNTQTGGVTSITANTQGRYVAPDLLVGTYDVQAKMTGFQTQIHTGVVITVGQNVVVDFSLPVGQVTETVTVQGATTQVETTTAEISAQIGQQQVQQLPLNGRNYEQLILLAPGVQTVTTGSQSSFYGREPSYSIAGSRPEGQELLLDGANIQGFWNHGAGNSIIGTSLGVEAIGEFQVLTNSYSARFGGSGSVMNATTKSGTNAFHGSVYDFFRNNVLDARDTFNTSASPMNPYRQNQFGGAVGGPIKRDKLFFFVNYEGIRRLRGFTLLPAVPDAEARLGNLPDCVVNPGPGCNPAALDTLPLNPTSQAIMALYPTGGGSAVELLSPFGGPSGLDQITVNAPEPANEDYVNTRWDYVLSEKNTIFGRYVFDDGSLVDPTVSPVGLYPETSKGRNQYITIGDKEVFSSNLINDARFTFTRSKMRAFVTGENPVLQFFSFYGENRQDGTVFVTGGPSPIGPSAFTPDFELQNVFSLDDDVFWVHGKHSFEIGAEFRRLQSPLANGFFEDQGWNFPSYASFVEGMPVAPGPPITLLGALPGLANSYRSFRESDLFPYIQDTWKVSRTVTLNLGLRYDFISNPVEAHNLLCAFIDPSSPSTTGCTPVSHVFASNPSVKSLDPRVGIAWDPFEDHKTSIRAGAGVFHDPIQVRNYHPAFIFAGPFQTAVSLCIFGGPPCSYPTPFLGITVPIPTIGEALEYDPRITPYVLQYNFGVQREIFKNTVFSLSYVGSRGYYLMVQNDLNPEIPTIVNGQPTFPAGSPRQNPNLGGIAFNKPDGSSWYNSLQAYLTHNLGKNLQFQASYTYSKCIDYGSIAFGLEAGNSGQQAQSDPYDLARDKGVCDFDVRHNFVANTVYRLPFRGNRWVEGWQVTGILTARSGTPFSIQDGIDQANLNNPAGQPGQRPDVTGESTLPPGGRSVHNLWFNPGAFTLQPFGTLGDLRRNTLFGPRFVDFDTSVAKVTRITEGTNLEFRAEIFNLFNHPNYGLPVPILTSPNFGHILGTIGTSRQIQFALKFSF
ncbi:MAG TPA: carboxypeptidase regulatory-like domain-containing protein [Candidatus Acidoferrales bacterium]|nr:carboxypeptidase regulatory-like domain-containing protein [Candidatus Acidoferrales bacterium]